MPECKSSQSLPPWLQEFKTILRRKRGGCGRKEMGAVLQQIFGRELEKEQRKGSGKKRLKVSGMLLESCQVRVDSLILIVGDKKLFSFGFIFFSGTGFRW